MSVLATRPMQEARTAAGRFFPHARTAAACRCRNSIVASADGCAVPPSANRSNWSSLTNIAPEL
jgi:hypothetical protein